MGSVGKMVKSSLDRSPNPSLALKGMSKIFRVTAAVPEENTIVSGLYDFKNFKAPYTNPNYLRTLTTKLAKGTIKHNKALGKMVGEGKNWAVRNFGNNTLKIKSIGTQLLQELSDPQIGLITPTGKLNRGIFVKPQDFNTVKNLIGAYFKTGKKGVITPKNIKLKAALDFKTRVQPTLEAYFASGRANKLAQRSIAKFFGNINETVARETLSKGVGTQLNPFIRANRAFGVGDRDWETK